MARVPYLQRRDNGVYYLQVRLPALSPGARRFLLRISLDTREFVDARRFVVARLAWVVPIMSTYTLKERMDGVSSRLAVLLNQPILDADEFNGRLVFEHVGRHVMQEINRGLPGTPPPEGFLVFCNLFTGFVRTNLDLETAYRGQTELSVTPAAPARSFASPNRRLDKAGWRPLVDVSQIPQVEAARSSTLTAETIENTPTRPPIVEASARGAVAAGFEVRPAANNALKAARESASASTSADRRRATAQAAQEKRASNWLREYLIADAEKRNDNTADRDVRPYVEFMIELLGDRPITHYTFEEFEQLNIAMCAIPTRAVPSQHRDSLMARYLYAQSVGFEGCVKVTDTTIMDRYGNGLNRFFGWLKDKRNIVIPRPSWEVYGDVSGALPRTSFNKEEREALFTMPLFTGHDETNRWLAGTFLTQSGIYWSYILEVVCGLRPSESAQLQPGDVKMIDGFMYFDMRPFDPAAGRVLLSQMRQQKTDNASRFVIAPPLLGELGFFELAARRAAEGHTRILCDLKPKILSGKDKMWGAAMARDWQERKKILNFVRQNVSAYSGRHLLKDLLKKLGVDEMDQERMMGHAVSKTSRGYGGKEGYDPAVAARIYAADTPFLHWLRDTLVGAYRSAKAADTLFIP